MEKDIKTLISGVKKIALTEKPKEVPRPPPIKACKGCYCNPGADHNGLCASCDPNHVWWTRK